MPLPVLPDAETLAVQALAAQASVAALVGSRIYAVTPDAPTFPLIRVSKVAERFTDEEGAEDCTVQLDCIASTDAEASLLARTVVAARKDMAGHYAAGWVALVDVGSGPIPLHDTEAERYRYVVDLDMQVGY